MIQDDVTVPLTEKRSFSPGDFWVVKFEKQGESSMKKTGCIVVLAAFFLLIAGISANPACALDCGELKVLCCIDGKLSQTVAKTTFSMCWSWSKFECVPCHGGHKFSYLAKWCNENNDQCEGKCRGCYSHFRYCYGRICVDKDGKEYCQ